jgi:hypothetical protein
MVPVRRAATLEQISDPAGLYFFINSFTASSIC